MALLGLSAPRPRRIPGMTAPPASGYLRLGRARLDLGRGLLLDETGTPVMLRRKSFEVLRVLTELAGRVVPRERLLDAVWGNVHVTDDSLTQCVLDIRRAIGDANGTILRTVPRRGYLLDVPPPAAPEAAAVAILPFANLGPGEEGRAFAEGLAEELINGLSRLPGLQVVSRSLSRAVAQTSDPGEVARALGARYLVEGSVRQVGDRFRVNARLLETPSAAPVWADSFQPRSADSLAAQDEVAGAMVAALAPRLKDA